MGSKHAIKRAAIAARPLADVCAYLLVYVNSIPAINVITSVSWLPEIV